MLHSGTWTLYSDFDIFYIYIYFIVFYFFRPLEEREREVCISRIFILFTSFHHILISTFGTLPTRASLLFHQGTTDSPSVPHSTSHSSRLDKRSTYPTELFIRQESHCIISSVFDLWTFYDLDRRHTLDLRKKKKKS